MQDKGISHYGFAAILAGSVLALHYTAERPDIGQPWTQGFWWMALLLLLSFGSYFLLLRKPQDLSQHRKLLALSVVLRLSLLLGLPLLSDDFHRYIWDGRLLNAGENPFALLPAEWLGRLPKAEAAPWQSLFAQLNSKNYYSVYPPVLQAVFGLSVFCAGGNVWLTVMIMKLFVVAAEIGSIYLLGKIAERLGIGRHAVLLYALNPLVILELSGNLHAEAFMIVFLLAAIWMLMQERIVAAAGFLTLSIAAKLLPVLIFPYLWKRLSAKQFWSLAVLSGLFGLAVFLPFLGPENLGHFLSSIRLYFQYFEFNSALHHWVKSIAGGSLHHAFSLALPWLMLALIIGHAIWEKQPDWKSLPTAVMVALTLYQLHSPVLHPWYILPLVALAVLGRYRYAILWSFLIPFTYIAYFAPVTQENFYLVSLEYVLLFGYMGYEWVFRRPQINLSEWLLKRQWFRALVMRSIPARLQIKQARISRHLSQAQTTIDIGCGHGGLCKALREEGFTITTVDIKNLSFFPEVVPILYDGEHLPFADKSFDTCTMITMLHHTPSPSLIIAEAMRVTRKRLIIMEDIYSNLLQRELTYFTDSLVNLEFDGHPHTNKTDAAWRSEFEKFGLRLVDREDFRTLAFFRQVIYVLELPEEGLSLGDLGQ